MVTIESLTALLVVITAVYAALTYGIMRATRASVAAMERQTEELTRPYVTVSPLVLPGHVVLFLRISNTGRTAANDLRLALDRPVHRFGRPNENLAELSAFTVPIPSFAPGAELIFSFATAPQLFGDESHPTNPLMPLVFKVTASYRFGTRTVSEVTEVDYRQFRGMHMSFDPLIEKLHHIAEGLKELKGIRAALGSLASRTDDSV